MTKVLDALSLTYYDAPAELQMGIRQFWPIAEWDNAARVAYMESDWSAFAESDTRSANFPCGAVLTYKDGIAILAEWSIGWFQINVCTLPTDWDSRRLFNTIENCGTAHQLWTERGWKPWLITATALGLL